MMAKYDKTDVESIKSYAEEAVGKRISEIVGCDQKPNNQKDKGRIGNLLQEIYFEIPRNSSTEPDFREASLELKVFGFWKKDNVGRADQRLSLATIDFMEFEKEVPFKKSHLYRKCRRMLWMLYLMQKGKDRMDSTIEYITLYEFDHVFESDMKQIERDYNKITKKIREGKAAELSEGDTEFLGAARTGDKGSKKKNAPQGAKALPRRFAFKQSYMSYLVNEFIMQGKKFDDKISKMKKDFQIQITKGETFEDWLNKMDERYRGKSIEQIAKCAKIKDITGSINLGKKRAFSQIGFAMLGTRSNKDPYLLKTNTVVKTVRISKKGMAAEDWSFPNFCICDIMEQKWEESEMFSYLSEQRFLILIFQKEEGQWFYKGNLFLRFTPEQLDECVKPTWESFKKRIAKGVGFELEMTKKGPRIYSDIQGKVKGQIGLIKLHAQAITYDIDRAHIHGKDQKAEEFINIHTYNGRFRLKPENSKRCGDRLPNGDLITKQSFWLNKDFIFRYIKKVYRKKYSIDIG